MGNLTSTPSKTDFFKNHMLRPFCLKWPSFAKNVDKFGEDVVLGDYAAEFAGKGYVAGNIKKGIESALDLNMCPDPRSFKNIVSSITKIDREKAVTSSKPSMAEKAQHRAMMQIILSKSGDIRETVRQTAPDFHTNRQNARTLATAFIDRMSETIIRGEI